MPDLLTKPVRVRYWLETGTIPGGWWTATSIEIPSKYSAPAMLVPLAEYQRLKRVQKLANDAVESGAVDEIYLSLLRDAIKPIKKKGQKHG